MTLVVDSPDTLLADSVSQARTLDLLSRAFGQIIQQSISSRLVIPIRSNSSILPSLLSTTFQARSPRTESLQLPSAHTLIHLVLHSPILFLHLVHQYHISLPPVNEPPEASTARFWSVFAPVASRGTGEKLVMAIGTDQVSGAPGFSNESTSRESSTGVIEFTTRARTGVQKGIRRVLKSWRLDRERGRAVWCAWDEIPALKACTTLGVVSLRLVRYCHRALR
jgi:hypothetical protein